MGISGHDVGQIYLEGFLIGGPKSEFDILVLICRVHLAGPKN